MVQERLERTSAEILLGSSKFDRGSWIFGNNGESLLSGPRARANNVPHVKARAKSSISNFNHS